MDPIEMIFSRLGEKFSAILEEHGLTEEMISVSAQPLTPEEAIGNPEDDDYPILKGKERMMEARFRDARGHAFTDMYGTWNGSISEVVRMELANNFRRAVFVATMNAVLRHLGLIDKTVHCKDDGPVRCAEECLQMVRREGPSPRIALIGHQPRMLGQLGEHFEVSVVDMDKDNIGKQVAGVTVFGPERTEEIVENADILLVTGTTLANGTIGSFLGRKEKTIFYGVTIAGAAQLLGLRRFCPFGL